MLFRVTVWIRVRPGLGLGIVLGSDLSLRLQTAGITRHTSRFSATGCRNCIHEDDLPESLGYIFVANSMSQASTNLTRWTPKPSAFGERT